MSKLGDIEYKCWKTLGDSRDQLVDSWLESWNRTPYVPLHRLQAQGVDCFQIVAAFLDDMMGAPPGHTELPRLQPSIARHRPDLARDAINRLRRAHFGSEQVRDGSIETGDIVVVRNILQENGHRFEGHTLIASSTEYRVLHAIKPRVCFGSSAGREIMAVYRPKRKDLWGLRCSQR